MLNVVTGILGATAGGCVFDRAASDAERGATIASIFTALLGAITFVALAHLARQRRQSG